LWREGGCGREGGPARLDDEVKMVLLHRELDDLEGAGVSALALIAEHAVEHSATRAA
jgi:hypothetical protein